jgi:ERCC4-type nuclease
MRTDVTTFPAVVLIDTREQLPFRFTGLRADAKDGRRPLDVTTRVETLPTGDYSLDGLRDQVAIERKSLADLYHTLGQNRDRFERELIRLAALCFAAVVIEADWLKILSEPPAHSRLNPKSIFRSVIAWQQRFPRVHWWACPHRRFAEIATLRILERFYKEAEHGPARRG